MYHLKISSGNNRSISFFNGTTAFFIEEHGKSAEKKNGTVIFRTFRENRNTSEGILFIPKLFLWEGPFYLIFNGSTGFSVKKESAPCLRYCW